MTNRTTVHKFALCLLAALSALCTVLALVFFLPAYTRAAYAAENGADHTEHGADWTVLTADGGTLTGGNYYLAADVKLTEDLTVSGTVTLCLNGYVLTGTGSGAVIMVGSGANFTLCDCREGDADVANEINGVTYNSGAITGGTGRRADTTAGGGIRADHDTVFTLNGGAIAGNRADIGGGVYTSGVAFIMNGGTIAGNTATGDIYGAGGGVCAWDCAFTMNGGTIARNTAESDGGGVYMIGDEFTMKGGTIADNTAQSGSGVFLSYSTFTINGGYFGAGSVVGGEVSVTGGYFAADPEDTSYIPANAIAGGCRVIQCAPAGSAYPYAVIEETDPHEHAQGGAAASFETVLTAAGGALPAGNYYLACDITLESDLTVSGTVTLCLNGYVLTGTGTGSVITVESGADFTLCDCREGAADVANEINGLTYNSGAITGGSAEQGGGAYVNGGGFAVSGGAIAGNAAFSGGGVYVGAGGTFAMSGGAVSGNAAPERDSTTGFGGAVYIAAGGTLEMSGTSEIAGNNAGRRGAGIYMEGGTFTMKDGAITGNIIEGSFVPGGGVCMWGGTFTMEGGIVSGNEATHGGGVCIREDSAFTLEGGAIEDNAALSGGGIYIDSGSAFRMKGGTVTGNEAMESYGSGVYINKGSFTMEGGYFGANLIEGKEDSASVSVTGGYFAANPEDCIAVGAIDGAAYTVVVLSDENHCGDEDYAAGYAYAVYRLADVPEYAIADIETTYGTEYTPAVSGNAHGAEVRYSWTETSGEGASANDTGTGLPQNAGVYIVTAVFANCPDGATKTYYPQGTATFAAEIARAAYDMSGVSFNGAVYTYDGTEKSLEISGTLPGGVTVSYSANSLTDAGSVEVTASFTGDEDNYIGIEPMTATLTVNKAAPSYELPENLTATAGQRLSEIVLPEGWSWADDTLSVGEEGSNSFTAVYTPADTANYETVSAELTVAVQSAGGSGGEETGGCSSFLGIGSAAGAGVIISAACVLMLKKGKRRIR